MLQIIDTNMNVFGEPCTCCNAMTVFSTIHFSLLTCKRNAKMTNLVRCANDLTTNYAQFLFS